MREDERERVCRQGTQAWQRLKKEKSWGDWLKVGEALQVGREWAMNQAGTNQPKGKGYNTAFGEWLTQYKLDDMDKGDRKRLFDVMDNLPQIEDWRQRLPLINRLKLNHPNAVLRKWQAFMKPEEQPDPNAPPKPTLRDSVANLSEENAAKNQRIAELEARLQEAEAARESGAAAPLTVEAALDFVVTELLKRDREVRSKILYDLNDRLGLLEEIPPVFVPAEAPKRQRSKAPAEEQATTREARMVSMGFRKTKR
jgi:hypothetical protein